MSRLAVVVDDYALATLARLDQDLARAGAIVMRSFRGLPNPHLLRRLEGFQGAAVVGGADRGGLLARLETASATLGAPVIAALPRGVGPSAELRGPGVVDLLAAGTPRAAERIVLMAHVPIVSSAGRAAPSPRPGPPASTAAAATAGAQAPARWTGAGVADAPAERVIAVVSSTGGVWVLAALLRALGGRGQEAVLVAQHMEPAFVPFFADWLGGVCGWRTVLVDEPTPIAPGTVYLAAGGRDLCVEGDRLVSAPPGSRLVPNGDRLLRSAAVAFGPLASGVVLSGMGSDGAAGLAELARRGGRAVCQMPSTASVPSMPESALRSTPGAAAVPPDALAAVLAG